MTHPSESTPRDELPAHKWGPEGGWRHGVRWFAAEFLVVLAGILAAVAINAWWSARQDRIAERAALRELHDAVSADIRDLQADVSRYRVLMHSDSAVLQELGRGAPYTDSLGVLIGNLIIYRQHVANSAPFESLKSRGLELISDDSLRLALVDFYNNQNSAVAIFNAMDTEIVQKQIWPYFSGHMTIAHLGAQRKIIPRDYAQISRDPYFRGILEHQLEGLRVSIPNYDSALEKGQELRAALEKQLARIS